jgi:hypothetical protein
LKLQQKYYCVGVLISPCYEALSYFAGFCSARTEDERSESSVLTVKAQCFRELSL